MKKLLSYLKSRRSFFFLLAAIGVIFALVFSLYALPLEPVLYATVIALFPVGAWLSADFTRFTREEELKREKDELAAENTRLQNNATVEKNELVDYFALWTHQTKTPIAALKVLIQSGEYKSNDLLPELFKIEGYTELALTYLRIQSMSSDLVLKHYPLDEIIRLAVKKNAVLFIHKKIQLELPEISAEVLTDKKWLVFVIEQLLSNALKYTPEGGVVSVSMNGENTLSIHDTGCGIAPEDLPKIFARGYTGHNGRTDNRASGLGLYLCKRVTDKLSHSIAIESEPGIGTTVSLMLGSTKLNVE